METTTRVTLKGLRKAAKAKFRARRSTILMNYGGMILILGSFLFWAFQHKTNAVGFALPIAIGIISLIYSITLEARFVDRQIQSWASNGQQLPDEIR